jgi:hypothetical protein
VARDDLYSTRVRSLLQVGHCVVEEVSRKRLRVGVEVAKPQNMTMHGCGKLAPGPLDPHNFTCEYAHSVLARMASLCFAHLYTNALD